MLVSRNIKGSALITALFIMALIAAAATALIYEQQLTIANAEQSFNYSQALQYSQLITDWAVDTLEQNLLHPSTAPADTIPVYYPTTEIPGGQYRGVLLDMQAKFNLNNLRSPTTIAGFVNMIKIVLPNLEDPEGIAKAISNYLSPAGTYDDSYDQAYQKAGLSYSPPHRPMLDATELRKVAGVTHSIYQALIPYVTALPKSGTALNINTASLQDLTSVGTGISLETAKAIANGRPYKNNEDIATNPTLQNHQLNETSLLTASSNFFVARSLVETGKQQLLMNSYIVRDPSQAMPFVVYQTQGSSE